MRATVRVFLLGVAERHRVDQGALHRSGGLFGQYDRLLDRLERQWRVRRPHPSVQKRAPRPRLAEVAHRTVWIPPLGLHERVQPLVNRERIHHLEALIEVRLGVRVGRGDASAEWPGHRRQQGNLGLLTRLLALLGPRR